jgi:hypothetical protein
MATRRPIVKSRLELATSGDWLLRRFDHFTGVLGHGGLRTLSDLEDIVEC